MILGPCISPASRTGLSGYVSPHCKDTKQFGFAITCCHFYSHICTMVGKYKVITLCGSTRFKEQFLEAQKRLTLEGNIVISVGLFGHSGDEEVWTEGTKEMLDDMHKRKIDMADAIYVINVGGYIGESTRSEIEYAWAQGKEVLYYDESINTPNGCIE